ncbi:MAG: helix-turn-helix domain-containing protein [Clostridia bacterium]|jgi:transcriptional regulator with XRE-family HTH domain
MLGSMISKIRKEKHITKVDVAKKTGINIGHLSHIEKGERHPSHKALRSICKALDIPCQPLMYTYDKEISDEHKRYKWSNHIAYNKVLAVDSLDSFIECPSSIPNASIALKIPDNAMEPSLPEGSYGYIEFNTLLDNKDIGLFEWNGHLLIRRFIIRKDKLVLRSDNKSYTDIDLSENDNFTIIGKVYSSSK